jgi:glycosyltransferase involved in cell wall biosynthesis
MRILIVTGIFPPDLGGPASYVPAIASALVERGHEVLGVVTLTDAPQDDGSRSYPVLRVARQTNRWLRRLLVIRQIYRAAADAEVVYLNGLVLEGIIAAKLMRRRRVVVKVVGDLIWERACAAGATALNLDDFQAARLPLRWRALRTLQRAYMRAADLVITPSRYLEGIVRGWDCAAVRTIYNACSAEIDRRPAQPTTDLVTVARLVPWKGIDELIDVAAHAGWSLDIVGEGPSRAALEAQLRALGPAASCIRLVGALPHERMADAMRSARVFVLNSSYEGLPHVVLEAKAAGVPVIATAAGGTREVVNDDKDGVLVPVGATAELRRAIAALLVDPAHRERLTATARIQLGEFSFGRMVELTEAALEPPGAPA